MFRLFAIAPIIFALLVPGTVHAALAQVFKGQVTSVRSCYPSGYALQVDQGTTTLIVTPDTTLVVPRTVIPTEGQSVYAIATSDTTCDTDQGNGVTLLPGRTVPYFASTPRTTPFVSPATTTPTAPGTGQQNNGSNSGSGLASQFTNFLGGELKAVLGGLAQPAGEKLMSALGLGGVGAAGAPTGVPFGGIITTLFPCTNGAIYTILGPPTPGVYIWMPGTISYLNGPPSFVGQHLLGLSLPPPAGVCMLGKIPLFGSLIVMHGSSGPTLPECPSGTVPDTGPSTLPPGGQFCNNPEWNKYAGDAIDKYGSNLMSGNVPGLATYCPNYSSLSQGQRKDFWTKAAAGIWKGETNCNSNSRTGTTGENSNGLFQLTPGDGAGGHPGACPLTQSNVVDPKTNITCGIAIMDGLSTKGIYTSGQCALPTGQRRYSAMDKYWTTLRVGQCQSKHNQESSGNILANMAKFPGCNGPATGSPVSGSGAPAAENGTTPAPTPSTGCTPVTAPPQKPPTNSCADTAGADTATPAGKASAERTTRATLAGCGVKVNKAACPSGASFRNVAGGCTDVGGLQCGATSFACDLAKKCGPYTITGGNEAGHITHSPGNAIDVVGIDQCIKQNFEKVSDCRYRDPVTGTTFLDEGKCAIKGDTTGPHFHVCAGGKGC